MIENTGCAGVCHERGEKVVIVLNILFFQNFLKKFNFYQKMGCIFSS